MDLGYIDFARLHTLHQAGTFFVAPAKSNLSAHRVYSAPTDRATGVIAEASPDPLGILYGVSSHSVRDTKNLQFGMVIGAKPRAISGALRIDPVSSYVTMAEIRHAVMWCR
jgi:hypothetical protein